MVDSTRALYKLGENKLSFVLQKVQKVDAGDYALTLENEHGKATASIKLIVLGEYFDYRQLVLLRPTISFDVLLTT